MLCTSCGRDIGPLPAVCRPCGKRFVPRKKVDLHASETRPAPIQKSAALDLHSMPTRPAPRMRRPAPGIHDAATQAAPVRKRPRGPSKPVPRTAKPAGSRRVFLLVGAGIAVAIAGGIFTWNLLNAPPADIIEEDVHLIRPASQANRTVDRLGDFQYRLEVTALDGPLQAVMGGVSNPDEPLPHELANLVASGGGRKSVIPPGERKILEGVIRNAYPIWIVFNLADGRSSSARVKLTLKEH